MSCAIQRKGSVKCLKTISLVLGKLALANISYLKSGRVDKRLIKLLESLSRLLIKWKILQYSTVNQILLQLKAIFMYLVFVYSFCFHVVIKLGHAFTSP